MASTKLSVHYLTRARFDALPGDEQFLDVSAGAWVKVVPVSDDLDLSVFTYEPPAKVAAPDFDPRIDYPERYTEGPI